MTSILSWTTATKFWARGYEDTDMSGDNHTTLIRECMSLYGGRIRQLYKTLDPYSVVWNQRKVLLDRTLGQCVERRPYKRNCDVVDQNRCMWYNELTLQGLILTIKIGTVYPYVRDDLNTVPKQPNLNPEYHSEFIASSRALPMQAPQLCLTLLSTR